MQERPRETLALIEAFVQDLLLRRGQIRGKEGPAAAVVVAEEEEVDGGQGQGGGGGVFADLRRLLAEGEGTGHVLNPGEPLPPWTRAEHEEKIAREEEEDDVVAGERGRGREA